MVKIRIRKEFWIEGGCRGKLFVYLPSAGEEGYLLPEIGGVGGDFIVLGERLHSTWGWSSEKFADFRYKVREVKGGDWNEVKEKLCKLEDESISALYKALDRYKEMQAFQPADEDYEVILR